MATKSKDSYFILASLIFGALAGMLIYATNSQEVLVYIKPFGDIFIRLLKMMIIPLVLSSIYMAIVNLGSADELGSMGLKAVIYYFVTTFIAVFIGLVLVNIIQPGVGLDLSTMGIQELTGTIGQRVQTGAEHGLVKTILNVFTDAIPDNPFNSMANMQVLPVITFAIFLGLAALLHKSDVKHFTGIMDDLEKLSMFIIHWIMKFAPIGIFALMASVVAEAGFEALQALGKYMATVLIGLFVHFIVLVLIGSIRHKSSPVHIIKSCLAPMLTAFSTSSSASTLPVTMAAVESELGVDRKTAQFVLPLGATVNMDGTALYESVAVIFIGQAYGLDLSIATQFIIFLTASLAAVGAAAIPGAGLVTMSIVLTAVGYPLDGIGLILAVDRILDMFRTSINVFGDCVGCVVIDSLKQKKS